MVARAIWKAEICLGDESVPVKLYSAAQDRKVHFRLLHGQDMAPVQQQMVDSIDLQPVAKEETRRGIEVGEGVFVIITDSEQAALEPPPSRAIRIEQIVDASSVDVRWFDRPYYLGPDGDEEGYFALAEALAGARRIGAAHWVMRKKRYQGALVSRDGYLLLQTLRHAEEMVHLENIAAPPDRAPDAREEKLAEQLISALEDSFDPAAYQDDYRERVLSLIEAKASGQVVELAPRPAKHKERSLIEDLEASLGSTKESAGGR